jgi:hypothetical protein
LSQKAVAAAEPRRNRAHGAVQHFGHVFIGKIFEVPEQDSGPEHRRQCGNSHLHRTGYLPVGDIVFGRAMGGYSLRLDRRSGRFPPPFEVDARIHDNAVKPGGERRIAPETVEIRHRFEKNLLRNIARRGCVAAEEVECYGIDFVLVGLIDDPKGTSVALPAGFQDFSADLRFAQTHRHRS